MKNSTISSSVTSCMSASLSMVAGWTHVSKSPFCVGRTSIDAEVICFVILALCGAAARTGALSQPPWDVALANASAAEAINADPSPLRHAITSSRFVAAALVSSFSSTQRRSFKSSNSSGMFGTAALSALMSSPFSSKSVSTGVFSAATATTWRRASLETRRAEAAAETQAINAEESVRPQAPRSKEICMDPPAPFGSLCANAAMSTSAAMVCLRAGAPKAAKADTSSAGFRLGAKNPYGHTKSIRTTAEAATNGSSKG
mmetsp:Transcript_37145/g.102194  ORF Transcript_37145/g.102194 Transcript_37145/m.102194 type:complete len:259 (+) Transcript_37145:595-1371(+)